MWNLEFVVAVLCRDATETAAETAVHTRATVTSREKQMNSCCLPTWFSAPS